MGLGVPSLVSCFAVKSSNLQLWRYLYGCYNRGCECNMKMLRANRGGGGKVVALEIQFLGLVAIHMCTYLQSIPTYNPTSNHG